MVNRHFLKPRDSMWWDRKNTTAFFVHPSMSFEPWPTKTGGACLSIEHPSLAAKQRIILFFPNSNRFWPPSLTNYPTDPKLHTHVSDDVNNVHNGMHNAKKLMEHIAAGEQEGLVSISLRCIITWSCLFWLWYADMKRNVLHKKTRCLGESERLMTSTL